MVEFAVMDIAKVVFGIVIIIMIYNMKKDLLHALNTKAIVDTPREEQNEKKSEDK